MSSLDYEIHIRHLSEEDGGGYLATVPELPGCMSDGETPQEALENIFDAINCWIEAESRTGRAFPGQSGLPLDSYHLRNYKKIVLPRSQP
jgi:antitoxin HicB